MSLSTIRTRLVEKHHRIDYIHELGVITLFWVSSSWGIFASLWLETPRIVDGTWALQYVGAFGTGLSESVMTAHIIGVAVAPLVYAYHRWGYDRFTTEGRRLGAPVLLFGSAAAFGSLITLLAVLEGAITGDPIPLQELLRSRGELVLSFVTVFAIPVLFVDLARQRIHSGQTRHPRVVQAVALIVLVSAFAPVVVGAVTQPDSGGELGDTGPVTEPAEATVAEFDDGYIGPFNPLALENVTVGEPGSASLRVQPTDRRVSPQERLDYAVAETHTIDPSTVDPAAIVVDNGTRTKVEGWYAFRATNFVGVEGWVLKSDFYTGDKSHSAVSLDASHDSQYYFLQLERQERGHAFVDIIRPNGEVHRYRFKVVRTDVNAAGGAEG